jgi:hypothetical protein
MKRNRSSCSNGDQPELGLDHVQVRPLDSIKPAPENDAVYSAIAFDDRGIQDLARSIKEHGIYEPLLISEDGYLISGHRRRVAALIAGLVQVPVRISPISRSANHGAFVKLLVECNSQRIKSTAALVHEELIKTDPGQAYEEIVNDRERKEAERFAGITLSEIDPADDGRRCEISSAKQPFLDAILRVLSEQQEYWPLSDRQIHYRLLGESAPLTHASKPASRYINNKASYRSLTDLLARGRINGLIPWHAIEDVTRPADLHSAFANPAEFFRQEFKNFLKGYWRNRLQDQPHHIEIVAEKLTVRTILEQVAREHTMPLTISRGMSSLPPKKAIRDRYYISGKDQLILLVVSDLDPAGDAIAEDLIKSFRRDFGIDSIEAYKVALTIEQVDEFALTPSMEAKDSSPTYAAFVERYGIRDAYELEAMEPSDLAQCLWDAIDEVLDFDAYNAQLAAEERDSRQIIALKRQAEAFFQSLHLEEGEAERPGAPKRTNANRPRHS